MKKDDPHYLKTHSLDPNSQKAIDFPQNISRVNIEIFVSHLELPKPQEIHLSVIRESLPSVNFTRKAKRKEEP